jgi:chromosomal replication initiator protein
MERVKDKFRRRCEVLLLEDMHFLIGKTKIQEEVLYTLDALLNQGRRVLLTSVRPPNDIPALGRLRSRLGSGLMVRIAPPDCDTRKRIIEKKAEKEELKLSENVKELLAHNLAGDIRLLESCVINLAAKSSLLNIPVTMNLAKEVLASVGGGSRSIDIPDIQAAVGREFSVSITEMRSKSRKKNLVYPRKLSMYLCRKFTNKSLKEIGRAFNRAHATVVGSVESIEKLKRTEPEVGRDLNRLKKILKGGEG